LQCKNGRVVKVGSKLKTSIIIAVLLSVNAIFVIGCAVPRKAYRQVYGQGPWDDDYEPGYFDHHLAVDRFNPGTDGALFTLPVSNIGRPPPVPTLIPGVPDIPEIQDEPSVLLESVD